MTSPQTIAIYGAGGFAREVAWLLSLHEAQGSHEMVGYLDDAADGSEIINGKPVITPQQLRRRHPDALTVIGVGKPAQKRQLAARAEAEGLDFAVLVHPGVALSEFNTLAAGAIVCCGSILTVNISLGRHVHVNLDCTIGHDVKVGDFTTIAPGAHISGRVHIAEDVYIGTGATIIDGGRDRPLNIGRGAVIGAGACVTGDVEADTLYVGVPAVAKKRLV